MQRFALRRAPLPAEFKLGAAGEFEETSRLADRVRVHRSDGMGSTKVYSLCRSFAAQSSSDRGFPRGPRSSLSQESPGFCEKPERTKPNESNAKEVCCFEPIWCSKRLKRWWRWRNTTGCGWIIIGLRCLNNGDDSALATADLRPDPYPTACGAWRVEPWPPAGCPCCRRSR